MDARQLNSDGSAGREAMPTRFNAFGPGVAIDYVRCNLTAQRLGATSARGIAEASKRSASGQVGAKSARTSGGNECCMALCAWRTGWPKREGAVG